MVQVWVLNQLSDGGLCSLYNTTKKKSWAHKWPIQSKYPKYMFSSSWCDLLCFGYIICRNVCLLSSIIDLEGISLVVLKEPKIYLKSLTEMCPKITNLLLRIIVSSFVLGLLCFCFAEQRCVSTHPEAREAS